MLRVSGHLVSFLLVIRDNIGMFLSTELFNGKSMGKKSSITKSCITPYNPIIIMGNLLKNMGILWKFSHGSQQVFKYKGKK